jgi:hypothetical protein
MAATNRVDAQSAGFEQSEVSPPKNEKRRIEITTYFLAAPILGVKFSRTRGLALVCIKKIAAAQIALHSPDLYLPHSPMPSNRRRLAMSELHDQRVVAENQA